MKVVAIGDIGYLQYESVCFSIKLILREITLLSQFVMYSFDSFKIHISIGSLNKKNKTSNK